MGKKWQNLIKNWRKKVIVTLAPGSPPLLSAVSSTWILVRCWICHEQEEAAAWIQGDQMGLSKNRPKCSPTNVLSTMLHKNYRGSW
jgi:hypothetical protein